MLGLKLMAGVTGLWMEVPARKIISLVQKRSSQSCRVAVAVRVTTAGHVRCHRGRVGARIRR